MGGSHVWDRAGAGRPRGTSGPGEPGKGFPINPKLKMARTHLAGVGWICRGSACSHVGLPRFLVAMVQHVSPQQHF